MIGVGSTFVVNGELSIGALIGFNIFSSRALIVAASSQRSYFNLNLINELTFNYKETFKNSENRLKGLQLNRVFGNIEAKNIDYSHKGSNFFLLKNVSFNVSAGEVLNISGNNGAGKTTLAKIILGIISPKSGEIMVDNTNLVKLSLNWWRKQVAYLPQNPEILSSSITDNILMANEKLNQEEISRLLQNVGLDDSLKKSNLSLSEFIEPSLSSGIKKKIHFARLIAMNPKVFLIDDPFGHLDSIGKDMVVKLISSLKKSNKTIITFCDDELINKVSDRNLRLEY
jgi:ATP-binding cassette subfamily C protein LapB